jgi:DtxR family transcriptional regulator, Mn-dependent transcriptional regulator
MPTEIVEEYLEAIFKLSHDEQELGLSRLAEYLKVTPASVSEMVKRLESQGFVSYKGHEKETEKGKAPGKAHAKAVAKTPGKAHAKAVAKTPGKPGHPGAEEGKHRRRGINLTPKGERIARTIVRRHRLSERFLTDVLGIDWEAAHREACKMEHAISPEVEEKLAEILGNPSTCPHGHPIPDQKGRIGKQAGKQLSDCVIDERGMIDRVEEEEPQMLHYLASLGLLPDVEVEVKEIAPFNGPLLVKAGGAQYALGREVASKIWLKKK